MKNAIKSYSEIEVRQELYKVYGLGSDSFISGPMIVTKAPHPFSENETFSKTAHEDMANYIVFDVEGDTHFAGDGNLVEGRSHNENYWFFDKLHAEEALVSFLSRGYDHTR